VEKYITNLELPHMRKEKKWQPQDRKEITKDKKHKI
jgi:hypothetical protein